MSTKMKKRCIICRRVLKDDDDWFEILGYFNERFCMKHDDDDVEELMEKADNIMSTGR